MLLTQGGIYKRSQTDELYANSIPCLLCKSRKSPVYCFTYLAGNSGDPENYEDLNVEKIQVIFQSDNREDDCCFKVFFSVADLVIYASLREEQSFPNTLLKAMCFGKPIVALDLPMIKKYVDDKVNGYLFPKENVKVLAQIMLQVVSNGKLSGCFIWTTYCKEPNGIRKCGKNNTLKTTSYLNEFERQWTPTQREGSAAIVEKSEEFLYSIWEDHTNTKIANVRKRREDQELKGRTDQPRGTLEEVYRSTKRVDRSRNDLRERDEAELERTGQPLCIYGPYFGEGT
ncbi:hypothetical protein BC332_02023 [Capsicum chinense]|nr:hypothetical protein BC332_02023 [Capsicum chinense]